VADVAIVGAGRSAFSRRCGMSIQELCFEAFREAMTGLKITSKDIDASIFCSAPEYDNQRTPSGLISEYLGLTPKPTFSVENVCTSSTTGLRVGWSLIKSGLHNIVAVIGFQKMSLLNSRQVAALMCREGDIMWESPFGINMAPCLAMFARSHMEKYGTTEEQMAKVRVKNARYGSLNPKATYQKKVSLDEVLNSAIVASPLKKLDCCANTDGSSCLILARGDLARKITDIPIWIAGLGAATAPVSMTEKGSVTSFASAVEAARQAYDMAGAGPEDIDVAELHDGFTIAEIISCEDLRFAPPGEGGRLIDEKQTYLGGKIPVNTDGGLLANGNPIGATGGSQVTAIVRQLRGQAGETQVNGAKLGLVHNIGGAGVYCNVTILKR